MHRPPVWLPSDLILLDSRCPLPLDRPFTAAQARAWGVSGPLLRRLTSRALVREVVHGAYAVVQLPETIELRAAALALVVAKGAVVTDRTAAWLHGVDALPRSAPHEPVPLDVFSADHSRLRRPGVHSGIRMLGEDDITTVGGVRLTTKLRTALDLGRSLPRYDAIGALDGFLRIGVSRAALTASLDRFKGYRGVIQLRDLVPLADPRAESAPESALRLHAHDAGLPALQPQFWVHDEWGVPVHRLDLALPALKYAAEYNGTRFHEGEDQERADEDRLRWFEHRDWVLDVFWKSDVYGRDADPARRLQDGVERARSRLGAWVPQGAHLPAVTGCRLDR